MIEQDHTNHNQKFRNLVNNYMATKRLWCHSLSHEYGYAQQIFKFVDKKLKNINKPPVVSCFIREHRPEADFAGSDKMVAVVNKDECVGCGMCVDACPNGAISMDGDVASVDPDMCIDCEACVSECPNSAISMQ